MIKKTALTLIALLVLSSAAAWSQSGQFTATQLYQKAQRLQFDVKANPSRINNKSEWEKIISSYQLVINSYPNDPLVDDIIFITGGVYKEMYQIFGNRSYLDKSIAQYRTVLRDYPSSYLQQASLFVVAEIQENYQKSPAKALVTYKNLVQRFPKGYKTSAARDRIAAIEKDLGQQKKAPALTVEKTDNTKSAARETKKQQQVTTRDLPAETEPENKTSDSYVASRKTGMAIIEDIRSSFGANNGRVTIELDREISYNYKQLSAPNRRIFFDLFNVNLAKSKLKTKEIPIKNSYLKRIRLGQNQKTIARVVLDFDKFRNYKIFTLPGPGDHFRIVFDLYNAGNGPRYVSANGNQPATSAKPQSTANNTQYSGKISNGASKNSNGKYSLSRQLGAKITRIVIDPGHGGKDPGTIGFQGMTESKLNLDVANRLKNIFAKEMPEIEVVLTRGRDVYLTLDQRPAISRAKEGDLFISIHSNAFRRKKASGIETYYMNYASDKEAEELAAKENALNRMSQAKLNNLLKKIMTNNKKEESKELAMFIQNHLYRQTKPVNGAARNRGVKSAPLVVLIGTNVPSVLVEVGFTNHPVEGKLLLTKSYRQRIATGLFNGIQAYIKSLQ